MCTTSRIFVGAALAAALLAAPALSLAGPGKKKDRDPEKVFQKLDANNDAKLTLEELKGKGKRDAAKVEKRFGKLDKNGDKSICLDEFKAGARKKKGK